MNYGITEEQIKDIYADGCTFVKQWFPEVFETKLEAGRWYKVKRGLKNELEAIVFFEGVDKESFGFSHGGKWVTDYGTPNDTFCNKNYTYTPATDTEVLEALTNEAKKRGFKKGTYVKPLWDMLDYWELDTNRFAFNSETNNLHLGPCVFSNGKWATIIQTYTKEEAEKMLNAKII